MLNIMQQQPTLFVAFSHQLTPSQIEGFKLQYCIDPTQQHVEEYAYNGIIYLDYIVTLGEVAPKLQQQMSAIPATASLAEIQELAKAIVAEAVKAGATHFYCVGEPTLTMWANLYAFQLSSVSLKIVEDITLLAGLNPAKEYYSKMTCIQSTTERKSVEVTNPDGSVTKTAVFQHVQWREMF